MKKRFLPAAVVILAAFILSACSTDPDKEAFESDFSQFCTNVSEIDSSINEIDSTSESASEELLVQLDLLNEEFGKMSSLTFPEEYDYLVDLASEAGSFMNTAVENYHTAFEGQTYDAQAAAIADQYYDRAYKRVQYMITFMRGETPDTDEVTYKSADETDSEDGTTEDTGAEE